MTAATAQRATRRHPAPWRPVLHFAGPGIDAAELDRLAELHQAATALCGARRVPLRPPFPTHATTCTACVLAKLRSMRGAL